MWAILVEFGIPVYVVFDGDAGVGDRMRAASRSEQEIATALRATEDANRSLLRLLGETETVYPPTQVTARYATLHDRLEQELASTWPAMLECADTLASVQARDAKNEDGYYQAALQTPNPPSFAQDIIAAVRAHANPSHSSALGAEHLAWS